MQSPSQDIGSVVELVVSSCSPDDQKAAVNKYFTPDAGFKNPLMKVNPGPLSRESILGIYQWYRVISPEIEAVVNNVAYDSTEDVLFVDVTYSFRNRILPFRPVPCRLLCKFELSSENGLHYIKIQEDFFHPTDAVGLLLPPLVPIVRSALSVSVLLANLGAKSAQVFGIWRATPGVDHANTEKLKSTNESPEDRDRRLKEHVTKEDEKSAKRIREGLERTKRNGSKGDVDGGKEEIDSENQKARIRKGEAQRFAREGNFESQNLGPYGVYKTGSVAGPVQRD